MADTLLGWGKLSGLKLEYWTCRKEVALSVWGARVVVGWAGDQVWFREIQFPGGGGELNEGFVKCQG